MKYWSSLILTLLSLSVSAQSLEQKIADETWVCFIAPTTSTDFETFFMNFINTCLKESFFKFKEDIERIYDPNGEDDYDAGVQFGTEFTPKVLKQLILECDKFYIFLDSIRWGSIMQGDIEKSKRDIEMLNGKIDEDKDNIQLHFMRGLSYFQGGDYEKAKIDFDKTLEINQEFGPSYVCLGWINEINQDFIAAKKCYERAYELTGNDQLSLIFISIMERKLGQ
jgi:tetratricopeptide (TPR) repeat protein